MIFLVIVMIHAQLVRSNKKTRRETGPVVDITYQWEWKYEIHEAEYTR